MGAVYAAEDPAGVQVAVKIVKPEWAASEITLARFGREARVASRLRHPRIAEVRDAGQDAGTPFMVMDLLEGRTLGDLLRARDRISVEEALSVARGMLEALTYAHEQGIVHRDLKPDNVFLVGEGDLASGEAVRLLDFGISKLLETPEGTRPIALTKKDAVIGTPYYISPEQARALPDVDGRADLFSLGAILFECLVGRPPFIGRSYEVIIAQICTKDVPALDELDLGVPSHVARWIGKALSRDRASRFATARAMLDALPDPANPVPDAATPPSGARSSTPEVVASSHGRTSPPVSAKTTKPLKSTGLLALLAFVLGILVVGAYVVSR